MTTMAGPMLLVVVVVVFVVVVTVVSILWAQQWLLDMTLRS